MLKDIFNSGNKGTENDTIEKDNTNLEKPIQELFPLGFSSTHQNWAQRMEPQSVPNFIEEKTLVVVSGPSGSGKSTLINMLWHEFKDDIACTVSHTTRNMRFKEVDGVHYHFTNRSKFEDMIKNDMFIEYIECFGNLYGTSKKAIEDALAIRNNCVMDIEWAGAFRILHEDFISQNIKKIGIVIFPPSIEALRERLSKRGSETEESLNIRLTQSFNGVKNIAKYEHIVINNNLEEAYKTLRGIYVENAS